MNWDFLIEGKQSITVCTDTRSLTKGCVFFALHGAHFDGNQFAAEALKQGASLVVIDDAKQFLGPETLLVPDTLKALQSLAREWVRYLRIPVIGLTGTNGKTTTKELLSAVLSTKYRVLATEGNLNNSIGVPLTLLQLNNEHELAVVEMGASHVGDIAELVGIAQPQYGLVTNVGMAHLEGFGSPEGVRRAKQELYDYLVRHGKVIFQNVEHTYLIDMYESALQAMGKRETHCKRVCYHTGIMPEEVRLVGEYNSENIQAALAVGAYFGVNADLAMETVCRYQPSNHRSQEMNTGRNRLVVDAYNANLTSMMAAINVFKGDTYILGAMLELGEYSHDCHQNIVNMLAERKAAEVLLVGKEWHVTTSSYPIVDDVEAASEYIKERKYQGRHILIKGSHGIHLEKLVDLL